MRVPGPVHLRAVGRGALLELLQVVREVRQRVFFDLRGQGAQVLPLGDLAGRRVAPLPQPPDHLVKGLLVGRVFEEGQGVPDLVDGLHPAPPFSTWARCRNLKSSRSRCAHPSKCIRHDMSPETTQRTPAWPMRSRWSLPMAAATASSVTEKVPPKPQHSSARSQSTKLMPLTFSSRLLGLENHGSFGRSLIDCSYSPRIDEQLTCSATWCGNSAHG